jgi:tRNA A37 threonylcarbamoyladenosine dehydratase
VGVVGLGGVGSWSVEALARSGVAELTLFDMDHVAESNINRQVQATGATVGQAKGEALRDRIADIHPGCDVRLVDDFVSADNWPALLSREIDVLIDACDQVHAKTAMAHWALQHKLPLVCVGAAGGKQRAQAVEVDDLALVTHDPLLASLRQRLRKQHGAARSGSMGVRCVFSREPVSPPVDADACEVDGSLNCHGYGSSVVVTASFGFVAAGDALQSLLRRIV